MSDAPKILGPYFVVGVDTYYPSGFEDDVHEDALHTLEAAQKSARACRTDYVYIWRIADGVCERVEEVTR